jgi:hypothetical protein
LPRIPNHQIGKEIKAFSPFINYNKTITAEVVGNIYTITHWTTKILDYNTETNEVVFLETTPISQTTSSLVGRIVRNLPYTAVMNYLANNTDKKTIRRISRQIW